MPGKILKRFKICFMSKKLFYLTFFSIVCPESVHDDFTQFVLVIKRQFILGRYSDNWCFISNPQLIKYTYGVNEMSWFTKCIAGLESCHIHHFNCPFLVLSIYKIHSFSYLRFMLTLDSVLSNSSLEYNSLWNWNLASSEQSPQLAPFCSVFWQSQSPHRWAMWCRSVCA